VPNGRPTASSSCALSSAPRGNRAFVGYDDSGRHSRALGPSVVFLGREWDSIIDAGDAMAWIQFASAFGNLKRNVAVFPSNCSSEDPIR
jgi:hypothetical protein